MPSTSDNLTKTAFPMLDMMINMQRLGLQAMSVYQPLASAVLGSAGAVERGTRASLFDTTTARSSERHDLQNSNEERVIAVGEEILNVGTRMVPGKTTRVRRIVVQNPVHRDVTLHTETVVLERRKPILSSGNDVLTEVTVEMSDYNEVPVVSKSVHLVEEVLLRKEVTARTETIHDTVRHDRLEIEQPSNLPVVLQTAPRQDAKRDETPTNDKSSYKAPQVGGNKTGDQKSS